MRGDGASPETPRATRRSFLALAGGTGAFLALARLRVAPALAAPGPDLPAGRFLGAHETEILTQAMERMVFTGLPDAPAVRDTGAVATVDRLLQRLDPGISEQVPLLLRLFEYGPWVFDFTFTRFTQMSDAEKDRSLEAWMTSRLGFRRLAFAALRNLCFFGYWSQDATWPLIGYRGPLLTGAAS